MIRTVLVSILLFSGYVLLLALVAHAGTIWAGWHPRGVSYGITMQYAFLFVCIQGALTIAFLRRLTLRNALSLTAVIGAAIVFFMFPGMNRGALPFLAMTLSATALCALYLIRSARTGQAKRSFGAPFRD
ncbi:hypothetical protein RZ532_11950 [Nitratireductor aquimarinus]|uniref:hypothetical protein n=1 Tax=Nitratireductor aquimarinus TaxID=889300 RepID=UPI002935C247|nr:hypothetical protein [Nitratireductor aquimarinus]MDV2966691.1 hypothetical protein [Nitratireductor aquimarinus]